MKSFRSRPPMAGDRLFNPEPPWVRDEHQAVAPDSARSALRRYASDHLTWLRGLADKVLEAQGAGARRQQSVGGHLDEGDLRLPQTGHHVRPRSCLGTGRTRIGSPLSTAVPRPATVNGSSTVR